MKLLKPSIGECLDRLTIIARKIEEIEDREVEVGGNTRGELLDRLREERRALEAYAFVDIDPNTVATDIPALAAVNAMIWDEQAKPDEEVRGARLMRLNRRRAELVSQLGGGGISEKL